MILVPYMYNGTDLTNYNAKLPGMNVFGGITANWSERAYAYPKLSGKNISGRTLNVVLQVPTTDVMDDGVDALTQLFTPTDNTPRVFICKDTADSNEQWYVNAFPVGELTRVGNRAMSVTLAVDEPGDWRQVSGSTDSWSITATGQTHDFNPVIKGNRPCKPTFTIVPTTAASTGSLYIKRVWIYSPSLSPAVDYPFLITDLGTSDITWDTKAEITAGRMTTDAHDIRVAIDGMEVDYWTSGITTSDGRIWVNLDLEAGQVSSDTMTLGVAMDSDTAYPTITFETTATNLAMLQRLPLPCTLLIGSEIFVYTTKYPESYILTGGLRARDGTAQAAHAAGAAVHWVQHQIEILYGDLSASVQVINDTKKPIIDMANSNNDSWVYTEFMGGATDVGGWGRPGGGHVTEKTRTGGWTPSVINLFNRGARSGIYTGVHGLKADPATEMGCKKQPSVGGREDYARIVWSFYDPFGITNVVASGDKYRFNATWPSNVGLECSINGGSETTWHAADGATQWADEATPTSDLTWEAWSTTDALGDTYHYLRFVFQGVTYDADALSYYEVQGVTLTKTGRPVCSVQARADNYQLNARLTNSETGEYIYFNVPTGLTRSQYINCDTMTGTYTDGRSFAVETNVPRHSWLDCGPGHTTLLWTAAGTGNVTVTISWEGRNT